MRKTLEVLHTHTHTHTCLSDKKEIGSSRVPGGSRLRVRAWRLGRAVMRAGVGSERSSRGVGRGPGGGSDRGGGLLHPQGVRNDILFCAFNGLPRPNGLAMTIRIYVPNGFFGRSQFHPSLERRVWGGLVQGKIHCLAHWDRPSAGFCLRSARAIREQVFLGREKVLTLGGLSVGTVGN